MLAKFVLHQFNSTCAFHERNPSHCHILFTKMLATFEMVHEQLLVLMWTHSQDGSNHSLS
jgi:hypothetical protein